jgi:hypothetical protein
MAYCKNKKTGRFRTGLFIYKIKKETQNDFLVLTPGVTGAISGYSTAFTILFRVKNFMAACCKSSGLILSTRCS